MSATDPPVSVPSEEIFVPADTVLEVPVPVYAGVYATATEQANPAACSSEVPVPVYVGVYATSTEQAHSPAHHRHFRWPTKVYLLLIAFFSACFTQYQPITVCVFAFHGAFLGFIFTTRTFLFRWLGTLLIVLGLTVSMAQVFRAARKTDWEWTSVGYVCAIEAGVSHLLLFLAMVHTRLARRSPKRYGYVLTYPVLVASCYSLVGKYSPLGTQTAIGYGLYEWQAIVQVVSLFGITGLNFFILVIAACAVHIAVIDRGSVRNYSRRTFSKTLGLSLLITVWIFGSLRLLWPYLYQLDISEVAVPVTERVDGVCIVWGDHLDPIEQTKEVLEADSSIRFLVWSEAAGDKTYYDDRGDLAASLKSYQFPRFSDFEQEIMQISTQYNVTIGASYAVWAHADEITDSLVYNNVIFIDPLLGDVLDYSKRNPVPIIENTVVASKDVMHAGTSSSFGEFNVAICFDYDFPDFIRTGTTTGVLVQPANTWGVVGKVHSVSSYMRAIENGAYLVRCGAEGPSGLWDYYGNSLVNQQASGPNIVKFQMPINPPRMWTLYAHGGFAIDYVLYGFSIIFFILLILTLKCYSKRTPLMSP